MSIAQKLIGYLGSLYNLYQRTVDAAAGIIIRKPGGTPGVQEVQIYHDGFNATYHNPVASSGRHDFKINNALQARIIDGVLVNFAFPITISSAFGFGVSGQGNRGFLLANDGVTLDVGIASVAAGIMKVSNASSGNGWLQQTAGRAVMTADVTESAAALTGISGLSITFKSGRKYTGQLILKCVNSTAADGIQLDFAGGTATMTSFWAAAGVLASNGTDTVGANISTTLAGVINYTVLTGETEIIVNFSGVCNAGGTFIVRIAENTHSTGTLTVRLGSSIWAEDMP